MPTDTDPRSIFRVDLMGGVPMLSRDAHGNVREVETREFHVLAATPEVAAQLVRRFCDPAEVFVAGVTRNVETYPILVSPDLGQRGRSDSAMMTRGEIITNALEE